LGVMGPDEYSPFTSNNAYTNRMAALNLTLAAGDVGERGGATAEERTAFAATAAALPIPRSDDGSLVLQCEEFEGFAEPRFEEFWTDRSRFCSQNIPQERRYRSKALKQADVLMLMMLFPGEFSDAEVEKAWHYYVPYTTHDSSLSAGVHALVACRLGLDEEAWAFWKKASGIDLDIAHGGAAEGIHIANAAASWMMAVLGFAGLSTAMETDVLTLRPRLPRRWSRLKFPLVWRETPMSVDIAGDSVTITNHGPSAVDARVGSVTQSVPSGGMVVFTLTGEKLDRGQEA